MGKGKEPGRSLTHCASLAERGDRKTPCRRRGVARGEELRSVEAGRREQDELKFASSKKQKKTAKYLYEFEYSVCVPSHEITRI